MTDNINNTEPLPNPEPTGVPIMPVEMDKDARMWAMFCHLAGLAGFVFPFFGNIIAPLIIWQIKKEIPFVNDQGKEAVNFQITVSIASIISAIMIFVCVGAFLLAAVTIAAVVLLVIAAIKANDGVRYRYPATIRFIK